jgi:hypothetical protein
MLRSSTATSPGAIPSGAKKQKPVAFGQKLGSI